jgi:hypothetical protein
MIPTATGGPSGDTWAAAARARVRKVELVQPGLEVAGDRRVREVHLEHSHAAPGGAGAKRQIDLDRGDSGRPVVIAVGVQMRQPHDGLAVGGVKRLVLGLPAEARLVVGVHHVAGQVAQTQA